MYELKIRDKDGLKAIIRVKDPDLFVPYDIRKRYYNVVLDYSTRFFEAGCGRAIQSPAH